MRIVRSQAENVLRMEAVEVQPDGTIQIVAGANAQGETSFLGAIADTEMKIAESQQSMVDHRELIAAARAQLEIEPPVEGQAGLHEQPLGIEEHSRAVRGNAKILEQREAQKALEEQRLNFTHQVEKISKVKATTIAAAERVAVFRRLWSVPTWPVWGLDPQLRAPRNLWREAWGK